MGRTRDQRAQISTGQLTSQWLEAYRFLEWSEVGNVYECVKEV